MVRDDETRLLPIELENAIKVGDLEQVKYVYSRIFRYVESVLGANHPRLAASLLQLANFYCFHGDYSGAETCCKRAIAIYTHGAFKEQRFNAELMLGQVRILRADAQGRLSGFAMGGEQQYEL